MKRFIKIMALALALCTFLGMVSCDEIIGELSDVLGEVAGDAIGDSLSNGLGNVFDDVTDLFDKDEVVMEMGNVQIDDKMMNYFFNSYVSNWLVSYSSYVSYLGLDLNKDLEDQFISDSQMAMIVLGEGYYGTWFDYFFMKTEEEVLDYMIWANYAEDMGVAMTYEDVEEIELAINAEYERLEKTGTKFKDWYGKGVDEDVIRRCLELTHLAENAAEYLSNNLENDITERRLQEWASYNAESLLVADCLTYTITVSDKGMTYEEYSDACDFARRAAEELKAATSEYKFKQIASAVANNAYGIDLPKECEYETYKYGYDTDAQKWLFSGAYKGDTYSTEEWESVKSDEKDEDGYGYYETFTVTVYYVVEESHYDERLTHSFAYAISNDKSVVYDIMEEVSAKGVTDGNEFLEIAARYCNQEGSNIYFDSAIVNTQQDDYGFLENMAAGCLAEKYSKLNEWIEDDSRSFGDLSEIFEIGSNYTFVGEKGDGIYNGSFVISGTVNGSVSYLGNQYAIVLFLGHGEETWKTEARSAVLAEMFEAEYGDIRWQYSSWSMHGARDIDVADLNMINNYYGSSFTMVYPSGSSGNVTYYPIGDATTVAPGNGDYFYSVVDPESITNSTIITIQPGNGGN